HFRQHRVKKKKVVPADHRHIRVAHGESALQLLRDCHARKPAADDDDARHDGAGYAPGTASATDAGRAAETVGSGPLGCHERFGPGDRSTTAVGAPSLDGAAADPALLHADPPRTCRGRSSRGVTTEQKRGTGSDGAGILAG